MSSATAVAEKGPGAREASVRDHPILMSGPMVRAALRERNPKTQTRRVAMHTVCGVRLARLAFDPAPDLESCPHGRPGDRLWVRETFVDMRVPERPARDLGVLYAADCPPGTPAGVKGGWRPSIFMPRDCSRITLELTGVRVERVQDISEEDARAEGVSPCFTRHIHYDGGAYRCEYQHVWDALNSKRGHGWFANPWVWVLEFRRLAA